MLELLAEVAAPATTDLWGLAGGGVVGGATVGGLIYWLTRSLIPRLMEQFEGAQARFEVVLERQAASRKESEASFLAALAEQRTDFRDSLSAQAHAVDGLRTTTERVAIELARFNDRVGGDGASARG